MLHTRLMKYLMVLVAVMASSCNPDVFIEPLKLSQTVFDVPFYGGTVDIEVGHGDWRLDRVAVNNVDIDFTDAENGAMCHKSRFVSLEYSRPKPSRLIMTVKESVSPDPLQMELYITNDYESEVVTINIASCTGYSFKSITYGSPQITSPEDAYEPAWSMKIINKLEEPAVYDIDIFDEAAWRKIQFLAGSVNSTDIPDAAWYDELMKYVSSPFDVLLPDPFPSDGKAELTDVQIPFGYAETAVPMDIRETHTLVEVGGGEHTVEVLWGYVEYKVQYVVTLEHIGEGRDLSFSGELQSKAYNGKWRCVVL